MLFPFAPDLLTGLIILLLAGSQCVSTIVGAFYFATPAEDRTVEMSRRTIIAVFFGNLVSTFSIVAFLVLSVLHK